jgi:hypothetical protein
MAEAFLRGEPFKPSDNDYDWLGPGIYFWEANPRRGLEFAREVASRKNATIKDPFVVGAVISLGQCLDLTTSAGIQLVRTAYDSLVETTQTAGLELPKNSKDLLKRHLDCAVIRRLHSIIENAGGEPIDTVKGVFVEGKPLYPRSGFYEKTHIQIAVCKTDCIKGVFRVPESELKS